MLRSNLLRYFFSAFIIAVQSVAFAQLLPSISDFKYIGEIPLGCEKVRNDSGSATTPAGFKISPDEAMKLAISKAGIKCNSKLQIVIYADSANYYIFNSVLLPNAEKLDKNTVGWLKGHSILVDGQTGDITDNRRN